jgi:hypothetical protein
MVARMFEACGVTCRTKGFIQRGVGPAGPNSQVLKTIASVSIAKKAAV